jgi:hypothetical protein
MWRSCGGCGHGGKHRGAGCGWNDGAPLGCVQRAHGGGQGAGAGADKEPKNAAGGTPLHEAASGQLAGQVEVITALVQLGVNKSAKDVHGATALHVAAHSTGSWRRST